MEYVAEIFLSVIEFSVSAGGFGGSGTAMLTVAACPLPLLQGRTALSIAEKNKMTGVAELLRGKPFDGDGSTALHRAAYEKRHEEMAALLQARCDPSAQNTVLPPLPPLSALLLASVLHCFLSRCTPCMHRAALLDACSAACKRR